MIQISKQEVDLSLLAENEEALGDLYGVYAEVFPNQKDFWLKIEGDEREHASLVRSLYFHSKVEKGIFFKEDRFNQETIKKSIEYTTQVMFKTKQTKVTLEGVLNTALYLEQSLLESRIFEVFETDELRFKRVLLFLKKETEEHVRDIESLKDKLTRRSTGVN